MWQALIDTDSASGAPSGYSIGQGTRARSVRPRMCEQTALGAW